MSQVFLEWTLNSFSKYTKAMPILILLLLTVLSAVPFSYGNEVDYHLANTNDPKLVALGMVPRGNGVTIFTKTAAAEPRFIYESNLRGKGFLEPFINALILGLRRAKVLIYVDYFTNAKQFFYVKTSGYNLCILRGKSINNYKNDTDDTLNKDKIVLNSNLISFYSPVLPIGIAKKKRDLFKKHLWNNTPVYNIKSILDDENLYTAQITKQGSLLSSFIYDKNFNIINKYKKRIYDFVASNSIQTTLMLNANRMDYVDLNINRDFYIKKLNIPEEKIQYAYASIIHPNSIKINDYSVIFSQCYGSSREELRKIIDTINSIIKKLRTNFVFWEKVLKQFAIDLQIPYESPKDFYFTKETMKFKKEIDRGDFDL